MAQLVYRVRLVKRLKVEKARTNKYHKKEKVASIEANNYISNIGDHYSEEGEVSVIELK